MLRKAFQSCTCAQVTRAAYIRSSVDVITLIMVLLRRNSRQPRDFLDRKRFLKQNKLTPITKSDKLVPPWCDSIAHKRRLMIIQ
jgi:hypothetical protein